MASGFKNSAGTDLDSLFLTNNQNAGAIGFKVSGGQDLGNRYSNATPKLGQTTGYKNSAGTDLGNLRSNKKPTSSGTIRIYRDTSYNSDVSSRTTVRGNANIAGVSISISGDVSRDWIYYKDTTVTTSVKVSSLKFGSVAFSYSSGSYKYTTTSSDGVPDGNVTITFVK